MALSGRGRLESLPARMQGAGAKPEDCLDDEEVVAKHYVHTFRVGGRAKAAAAAEGGLFWVANEVLPWAHSHRVQI